MHSRSVHQDDAAWEGPRIVDARRDQRGGGRLRLQRCVAKPAIAISFDEPLHRGITKVADAVEENEWWLGLAYLVGTQPSWNSAPRILTQDLTDELVRVRAFDRLEFLHAAHEAIR